MTAPMIGVLALQGDVREHRSALTACGAETSLVRTPDQLATVDALVIPGGESSTMDKLLRAFEMHVPLQLRVKAGMPVYGSCAGLIALANTIHGGMVDQCTVGGMDMVVRRNAFGRQVDSFETDLHVTGIDEPERPFRGVFIRAPWVESVGEQVEVLATVPARSDVPERVVAVRQGSLLATSFHPELTDDHRIHGLFVAMVHAA